MSPHAERKKKQAHVTLIKQWKERGDRGGETASKESPRSGETLMLEMQTKNRQQKATMPYGPRAQGILAHAHK